MIMFKIIRDVGLNLSISSILSYIKSNKIKKINDAYNIFDLFSGFF